MPASAMWLDDHKLIIHECLVSPLMVSEVVAVAQRTYDLIDSVPHEVILLFDTTQLSNPAFQILSVAREISRWVHPRQTRMIGIAQSVFFETLASLLSSIAPRTTRDVIVVRTFEEALRHAQALLSLR